MTLNKLQFDTRRLLNKYIELSVDILCDVKCILFYSSWRHVLYIASISTSVTACVSHDLMKDCRIALNLQPTAEIWRDPSGYIYQLHKAAGLRGEEFT